MPERERPGKEFVSAIELETISIVRQGLNFMSRSRFADAEAKLRQGQYLYPEASSIRINLAEALKGLGNFGEAIEIYRQLLRTDPDSVQLLAGLARVYLAAGDVDNAVTAYEEAFELAIRGDEPERAAGLARSLATLYFGLGQEEEALCYSQRAVEYQPARMQTLRHIRLLTAIGLMEQADQTISDFVTEQPGMRDAEVLWQMALIHAGKGDFEQAAGLIDEARDKTRRRVAPSLEMELFDRVVRFKLNPETAVLADEKTSVMEDSVLFSFDLDELDTLNTLYWPATVVQALMQFVVAHKA